MKKLLLLLLLLAVPAAAVSAEEEPTSRDFGYGFYIEADNGGAVYSLPVPNEVYRTVRRADLGDIMVFNGAGEPVPHALRSLETAGEEAKVVRSIPFFPLHEEEAAEGDNMTLSVRRNADGTIIDIDSGRLPQGAKEVSGYLLDLGEDPREFGSLEVYWRTDPAHASGAVMVRQSSDLQYWRTVTAKTTLVDLDYAGNHVEQRTIALPGDCERYLKITWLQPQTVFELERVAALSRPIVPREQMQWVSLYNGSKGRVEGRTVIDFTSPYRLPVRSVRLRFPEANSIVNAAVQSRPDRNGVWRDRCRGVFYTLEMAGERVEQEICSFAKNNDREWRLVVLDDGAGLAGESRNLLIELGWQSDELLFLARGGGPFLLAYGSGRLENGGVRNSSEMVLTAVRRHQSENVVHQATLGKRLELGGERALVVPPPPRPWKTWLLWAVLAAGVLGMALMAVRLQQELRGGGKE